MGVSVELEHFMKYIPPITARILLFDIAIAHKKMNAGDFYLEFENIPEDDCGREKVWDRGSNIIM